MTVPGVDDCWLCWIISGINRKPVGRAAYLRIAAEGNYRLCIGCCARWRALAESDPGLRPLRICSITPEPVP